MGWYDTFRNTKINYYFIDLSLVLAPLLFFYVKTITASNFKLTSKILLHFVPWLLFFLIKLFILIYDASLPEFNEVQNGYLVVNFQWKYIDPIVTLISMIQMLLYLIFSFQLLYLYRNEIQNHFSNTYKIELNWLRNFLVTYSFLHIFISLQTIINAIIIDLSWIQEWWYYFFSVIAIIYIGIKGYFTDLTGLNDLGFEYQNFSFVKKQTTGHDIKKDSLNNSKALLNKKETVEAYLTENKPYLEPDLSLINLSKKLNMSREELSEIINKGFQVKFNDLINSYRIDRFKEMLAEGKHENLSLLGIAFECGFNSKPTFNRAFKKFVNTSPSQYLKTQS